MTSKDTLHIRAGLWVSASPEQSAKRPAPTAGCRSVAPPLPVGLTSGPFLFRSGWVLSLNIVIGESYCELVSTH